MRNIKHLRPDYVSNFKKPPHTEIKYINGNWYLYSVTCEKCDDKSVKKKLQEK